MYWCVLLNTRAFQIRLLSLKSRTSCTLNRYSYLQTQSRTMSEVLKIISLKIVKSIEIRLWKRTYHHVFNFITHLLLSVPNKNFSSNSEAKGSELLENLVDMLEHIVMLSGSNHQSHNIVLSVARGLRNTHL